MFTVGVRRAVLDDPTIAVDTGCGADPVAPMTATGIGLVEGDSAVYHGCGTRCPYRPTKICVREHGLW